MGLKLASIAVLLVFASSAVARRSTVDLAPFHTLSLCAPVDLQVKASTSDTGSGGYQLVFSGQQATRDIWDARVVDGVLQLATTSSFNTQEDLTVTVLLPADALKRVELKAAASVYIEPGFTGRSVALISDTLLGSVSATGAQWQSMELRASGMSRIFVEGEVRDAVVAVSDTATAAISGLKGDARVRLTAAARVTVLGGQGSRILGSSEGGQVIYKGGECSVMGSNGASLCVEDAQLTLSPPPAFLQCTLTVSGSQSCSATPGTSASASAKVCQATGSASIGIPSTSRRRLRQAANAYAAAQALLDVGSRSAQPTSYTYTSTSTGGAVTTCNFFNSVGSCTVNGTPVPTVEVISGPVPGPGPAQQELLSRVASALSGPGATMASAAATTSSAPPAPPTATGGTTTMTSTSGGGTGTTTSVTSSSSSTGTGSGATTQSCTFVNGVGGCTTG